MSFISPTLSVRPFAPKDLPAALALQVATYPEFLVENAEAFASRLSLVASYCLIAERDGVLVAYLLAHGWRRRSPPSVGSELTDLTSEVLFIHDLAVSSAGRGFGVGRTVITHAFAAAARDGLRDAELIAVEKAGSYWRMLGFSEAAVSAELAAKVASYGPESRWMTRAIPHAHDGLC